MITFDTFTLLAIVILAGVVSAYIAIKIKLPTLLGYLFGGIVLSLLLPHEVLNNGFVNEVAQLGAALLLFTIGVEFSWEQISKVRNVVLIGSVVQALLTLGAGLIILPIAHLSQFQAFLIAALISSSSTSFVIQMLEHRGELQTTAGKIMVGWLIMQDLLVVGWFLMFNTLSPNATAENDIIVSLLKAAVMIVSTLAIGKYILPWVMAQIAKTKSEELLVITVVGVIVLFAAFANLMGVSFTLGAFLAGLALSESFLKHEVFSEIKPLRNVFMMVFFVSIGTLFNVNALLDNIPLILLILIVLIPIKGIIIVVLNLWFDVHIKNALKVGVGIMQIGEFAFLGVQIALEQKWIDEQLYAVIIATTVISMALTPILYNNTVSLYQFLESRIRKISPNLYRSIFLNAIDDSTNHKKQLTDHVIVCGSGRVGRYVIEALAHSEIPCVVIELDSDRVSEMNELGTTVIYGDSSSSDVLTAAHVQTAKALVIALPETVEVSKIIKTAKELNPQIRVVARSHQTSDYGQLDAADMIVEPEFEAAVQIISNLYKLIRRRQKRVIEIVRQIKQEEWGLE